MSTRAKLAGVLIALVILVYCTGCSTTATPLPCDPVYVTDYEKPTPLPLPEEPTLTLDALEDDADWRAWLESIGIDFARLKADNLRLRKIIESYNETVANSP